MGAAEAERGDGQWVSLYVCTDERINCGGEGTEERGEKEQSERSDVTRRETHEKRERHLKVKCLCSRVANAHGQSGGGRPPAMSCNTFILGDPGSEGLSQQNSGDPGARHLCYSADLRAPLNCTSGA